MADDYDVQELILEPGDRLVFLTDGMLERNASEVDVASVMASRRHLHPREAVQELTEEVVTACGGKLLDDATVLCFDWHGESGQDAASGS
jgi:serine phosphatase RsbU (regulator of sigma subunit)